MTQRDVVSHEYKVLVCGGRDYAKRLTLKDRLDAIHAARSITLLIHGAARGADTLAHNWAMAKQIACSAHPANWARYGPAAGPIRNAQMLEERPDVVVAFPGGKGTENMKMLAQAAGVPVIEVE